MDFSLMHPADQVVLFMNRIYQEGLTTTSGGNLSIMDDEGNIWITPSGIDKGTLTRNDIMCVKPDGTVLGPHKPSMELPFHSSVYKIRSDLRAVLHAHPPALVSFSVARVLPDVTILPCVYNTCGKTAMATYAIPGSTQLGENVAKEFKAGFNSVILENHGACVAAKTMYDAYMMFETLESCAIIESNARKLGKPVSLTEKQLKIADSNAGAALPEFEPDSRSSKELAARRDMVPFLHRCCTQHLFGSTRGTYSLRLDDSSFIITPERKNRFWLEENDFVLIKNGKREKGKLPSQFVKLHEAIYRKHPEINSIAATEPFYTAAFAVTGTTIDSRTIPESYIQLRTIGSADYSAPYTDPDSVASLLNQKTAVVLCKNGQILATGVSLTNAFDRLEVAEATAHSLISAKDVGPLVCISDTEINAINKTFNLP